MSTAFYKIIKILLWHLIIDSVFSYLFYCTVIISKKQYIKTDKLLTYLLGLNGKAVITTCFTKPNMSRFAA